MKFGIIFLALVLSCEGEIVQTQYGPVEGVTLLSELGSQYESFTGIPYMKPPIEKLRFRDPEPPEPWTDPLDCTQEGPRFPQIDFTWQPQDGDFYGDLDSMHINVYTKDLAPTQPYPVLVWIHGGGFRTGSGLKEVYGPDYLVEENVTLVTFNYRLHAFGFLSLDDPELKIPGNAGMKDQVMALKWVKENIKNFGGDPTNITIFGQSSGGGCAHYHTLSNLTNGLFQRAIIMSGSAFNNMYAAIPRRNWAARLAARLNYTGGATDKEVLAFLELADPEDIFRAVGSLLTAEESDVERILNAFGPTIEPYVTPNAFMLDHPERLAPTSWGRDIDIMIGTTSFENGQLLSLFRFVPDTIESFSNFSNWLPFHQNYTASERIQNGKALEAMYYGLMKPTISNPDGLIALTNDFAFTHAVHRVVSQRWRSGGTGKSYVYRFDAVTDNNCFSTLHQLNLQHPFHKQPIHMDDLCHLFKPSFTEIPIQDRTGWNMTMQMIKIFADFAATGNPGWNASTGANNEPPMFGFNINVEKPFVGRLPEVDRMEVWDTMFSSGRRIEAVSLSLMVLAFVFKIIL